MAKDPKKKLFKALQRLDQKIGRIDRNFGWKFKVWPEFKDVKAAKLRREKLDLRRAKARIERKKYGIKPKQP